MNERIKEFEKQAWDYVDQTWDWARPDNPSQATLFRTKFAELIVKECADIADDNYIHRGSRTCGLAIRQHFGVEE